MCRILYVLLSIAFIGLPLKAQVGAPRYDLAVGASAGVVMSRVSFDPTIRQKQMVSPTLGLTFRYTSERYFTMFCAFQAELNYARLGWQEDIVDAAGLPMPDYYQHSIHYLQMPLLASLGWGREYSGVMFRLQLGPQIGVYLADSELQRDFTYDIQGHPARANNVYQQYGLPIKHKIDYGLTGGIALELNNTLGHFTIEGRYYYGLADLFGNAKADPFARSSNQAISVKVGYLLPLKGQHPRLIKN